MDPSPELNREERLWLRRVITAVAFVPAAFQLVPISLIGLGLYSRLTADKWIAFVVPIGVFLYSFLAACAAYYGLIRVLQQLGTSSRIAFAVGGLVSGAIWALTLILLFGLVYGFDRVPSYGYSVFLPLALLGSLVGGFMLHVILSRDPATRPPRGKKPK